MAAEWKWSRGRKDWRLWGTAKRRAEGRRKGEREGKMRELGERMVRFTKVGIVRRHRKKKQQVAGCAMGDFDSLENNPACSGLFSFFLPSFLHL
jgi:hypothetical protein